MSNPQSNELEKFITDLLEVFSAGLAKSDAAINPETLAYTLVEFVAQPRFWNEETKAKLRAAVLPVVEKWYRA